MTTIIASASGGTRAWSDTATWVGGVVPTAANDVQLDATSGNVTINTGSAPVCRSFDCSGYTGTLTHNSSTTLTVGDGTAGASNIALKLVAGMTYNLGSAQTSAVTFASTSGTVQTIDAGGKNLASWTINGVGSSYRLDSGVSTGTAGTVTLTAGTLDVNGQTCSWGGFASANSNVRSLILGAASISITSATGWSCATATNLTLSAGTSTINFTSGTGTSINLGVNLNYNNIIFSLAGVCSITSSGGQGTGTIANLTRTGTAVKTDIFQINTTITVAGTLTVTGNSVTNRMLLVTNVHGQPRSLVVNGSVVASNVDVGGILASGSASWNLSAITGGSGDCGANTGITFTTAAAQTWQGTSGGNWSDVTKWTSRVPLPQDDVTINAAFTAAQTVTMDMPRLAGSIDWTGATGSPAWAITSTQSDMFGSLTLVAGMSITGTGSAFTFRSSGTRTITTNGVTFPGAVTFTTATGTYTLQDALTVTGVLTLGPSPHRGGTLNTNGQAVTCSTFAVGNASSGGSTLTLGASTVTLTSTAAGAIFNAAAGASPLSVINPGTSTIVIANASANDRNVVAQGLALNTVTYTVAGSTGKLILGISGSTGTVTIGTVNFSDASNARTLRFWAGITCVITSAFNVTGTSGKLMTIDTSTGGTRATLSKASGAIVTADYLSVIDSAAGGGAAWYAGGNSTNAGNNTGWIFTAAPDVINAGSFFAFI